MPVERSAGAVIFRETQKEREYLLLQHPDEDNKRVHKPRRGHWDFAKGHIDKGEKTEDAVRREVKEETGISRLKFLEGFKETIRYFVNYDGARRLKFVAFFLVRTSEKNVKISWEHQGYAWLPYEKARAQLTYENARRVLEQAHRFLQRHSQHEV